LAIPGIPQNFYTQQGNGEAYLSWDLTVGATSYDVRRSTDGITFATIATPGVPNYSDTAVTVGTQYYYKVAATNGSGTSPYTSAQSVVPTLGGEMSLGELRTRCQQRADRLNSNFVTLPEWNSYIMQSMYELYDLLITSSEEYFVAPFAVFTSTGQTTPYPLPNGATTFLDTSGATFVAQPLYKLLGVDLAVNTSSNAWVTVRKFMLIDRNRFIYPNTASTMYGVFNMQYRMMGNSIQFVPTPSANQQIRLLYIPKLPVLMKDNDITTTSISGWLEYVITDAAIKALQKEESDVTVLVGQKIALRARIEETSVNRDEGQPDHITDVNQGGYNGQGGWSGPRGGW